VINRLVGHRYEVTEKIDESPLFTLYKARDNSLDRMVACKMVTATYAADRPFIQGLTAGLMATTRLEHPNIAQFYEFSSEAGTPYAIFEFVRGVDLKERIRRIAPFTLAVAVDIVIAVSEALHFAHNLGQSHGDLRPHNIIVSPEGAVKVTDFGVMSGISRSLPAQRETLLRAAPYHAPELSTSQAGTPAGDIYAVGAVLYEMLTGTPVYAADSVDAIADLHAFAPIPSARSINPGVPRSVEGIIVKCLQKRLENRYRSFADLLADLKAVRDALRFGKPLSWSPIDLDQQAGRPSLGSSAPVTSTRQAQAAAVSGGIETMRAPTNRLRARDERVSIVWKVLIGFMTGVILLCLIGFVAVYSASWVVQPPVTVPQLVGKPLDEVQAMAEKLKIHLITHGDYMDKPRNLVYKTDQPYGVQIQPKHYVNIWYSKGPLYVDVPDVTGIDKDQAEQKLKDAGLTIGKVMPQYDKKSPRNAVISQNVSFKKRVLHDTAVDLIFSDGPQPEFSDNQPYENNTNNGDGGANGDGGGAHSMPDNTGTLPGASQEMAQDGTVVNTGDDEQHEFTRNIDIPKDGKGRRQVKIEMIDQNVENSHLDPIVIVDEMHDEGDRIPVNFQYHGKYITLRIYFDRSGTPAWSRRFDPLDPKSKGRIN